MLWSILLGIVLVALGALSFFKPETVWRLSEKWKSYNADEPSDRYRVNAKIGGVGFGLLGLMMVVLPLVLK